MLKLVLLIPGLTPSQSEIFSNPKYFHKTVTIMKIFQLAVPPHPPKEEYSLKQVQLQVPVMT